MAREYWWAKYTHSEKLEIILIEDGYVFSHGWDSPVSKEDYKLIRKIELPEETVHLRMFGKGPPCGTNNVKHNSVSVSEVNCPECVDYMEDNPRK